MNKLRFALALFSSKLAAWAINIIAPSRGTTFPGRVALKLDPLFLRHVQGASVEKTVFVTGTNGKSTTTNILSAMLQAGGKTVVSNLEGANLLPGVATALLKNCDRFGHLRAEYILMETDERFLPLISRELPMGHLLVTNIQKDQVQRNGEPDIIYRKIRRSLLPQTCLYVNNDEPYAASLARYAEKSVRYGVAKNARSFTKAGFYTTTLPCPVCGAPIRFALYNIDNIGPFYCDDCGFASAEQPEYLLSDIDAAAQRCVMHGRSYTLRYDAPYFYYCYAGAMAVARELGVSEDDIAAACDAFTNIDGRMEDLHAAGKTIHYLRMKQENPETLQSALDQIANDPKEKIFMLGLDELVDFEPHYTNTFYAFDCDFQRLIDSHVQRYICFSGTVSYDAALRLVYAGVNPQQISVVPSNDDAAIMAELEKYPSDNVYLITWLKKFYSLRKFAEKGAGK